jgi:membrane protein YqaA with SNARE-associated domain
LICALGSLAGGALGYYIGYAFFDTVGKAIIDALSLADKFQIVGAKYEQNVFWSVFAAAFTPIPYKVFTLAAGFFKVSFASFFLASVIGRSLRFFLVASAIFFFGPSIQKTLEQHFNLFSIVFTLLLIGGFLLIKLL